MKKGMMYFLMITGLSLAGAQAASAQKSMGPEFGAAVTVVDFGEVDASSDSGYRMFSFTNTGTEPLLITATEGSCGCTTPEKPTAPIKPGAKGEIKIKYDITRKGTFSKTVTITTNEEDGKNADGTIKYKQHVIQVKGNVK